MAEPTAPINHLWSRIGQLAATMAEQSGVCYMYARHDADRSQIPRNAPPPVSPDSGADAGAQLHYLARNLRGIDGDPPVDRGTDGTGGGGDRVRSRARWSGRPGRTHD